MAQTGLPLRSSAASRALVIRDHPPALASAICPRKTPTLKCVSRVCFAPNAPSHRSLWSPKEAKARRAGKNKYKLDDEDNQKWDLWKRKVGSGESAGLSPTATKDEEAKENVRSTPMAVAPPTQYIAAGSGIGPRPLREATMIDPDNYDSTNAFSAFDRHLQARTVAPAAAEGLAIGKRTWGYGSFKDDTSGFEVEPRHRCLTRRR